MTVRSYRTVLCQVLAETLQGAPEADRARLADALADYKHANRASLTRMPPALRGLLEAVAAGVGVDEEDCS